MRLCGTSKLKAHILIIAIYNKLFSILSVIVNEIFRRREAKYGAQQICS